MKRERDQVNPGDQREVAGVAEAGVGGAQAEQHREQHPDQQPELAAESRPIVRS